jgi:general secretion pathway protein G
MKSLIYQKRNRRRGGFTLIELLLVMVIIAILATLLVPNVMGHLSKAKNTKAQADLSELKTAVTSFYMDNDKYPSKLDDLVTNPGDLPKWTKLLDRNSIPLDPWGRPYVYRQPGSNGNDFDLFSTGASGQEGNKDNIDANNPDKNPS